MTFVSIPGTNHNGDRPRYEKRAVKGPDGETLYERQVYEDGYDSGFDGDDGLNFNGGEVEKIGHEFDRAADRNTVGYRVREPGAHHWKEIHVDYERDNQGNTRLARYRENR